MATSRAIHLCTAECSRMNNVQKLNIYAYQDRGFKVILGDG